MRAGKRFTIFISNEDMNDIIKIIISLQDSDVLIDGITETVKYEIKSGIFGALLAPLAPSIVQLVISSVVKGKSRREVRRAGRGFMNTKFLILLHPLSNIEIIKYFNTSLDLMLFFSRNNLPRINCSYRIKKN